MEVFVLSASRDVISVFSKVGGVKILNDLLGGAKYKFKKIFACKNTETTIFLNQGGQMPPQMTSLSASGVIR